MTAKKPKAAKTEATPNFAIPAIADESAPDFILRLLGNQPEYEWQIVDIHAACGDKWTKSNLNNALDRLLKKGAVARTVDPNRSAWWSIAL